METFNHSYKVILNNNNKHLLEVFQLLFKENNSCNNNRWVILKLGSNNSNFKLINSNKCNTNKEIRLNCNNCNTSNNWIMKNKNKWDNKKWKI